MARALLAGLGVLAAVVLTACGDVEDATPGTAASSSASWDPVPGLEQSTPPPDGLIDEDTGQTIQAQPVPTWDATSTTTAVTAAETVMTAFARPDLAEAPWWAGVQPLLSPQAAEDYAYVDPASVPATQVTGPGTLVEDTSAAVNSAYVASVEVPTDAGPYLVVLSRSEATTPWLVERVSPPDDLTTDVG